jgi:hypothetical protein
LRLCGAPHNRKNALFASHDVGAENWACLASLVETCKLHGIDPQAYFADVLTKLVNLWPESRLDELMPGPGQQVAQPISSRREPHGLRPSRRTRLTKKALKTCGVSN